MDSEKLTVPEDHAAPVRKLIKERRLAQIRIQCHNAQIRKAIEANEPERAYDLIEAGAALEKASDDAHQALWKHLGTLYPQISPDKPYNLDEDTLVITLKGGPLASIKAALEAANQAPPAAPPPTEEPPAPAAEVPAAAEAVPA